MRSESNVLVRIGPIIGKVTSTTAIILLEVDVDASVTVVAIPHTTKCQKINQTVALKGGLPYPIYLENLEPKTEYSLDFKGLAKKYLDNLHCVLKTLPLDEDINRLRFVVVSCDRFSRLDEKDENPWGRVLNIVNEGECDVMLHLGDQIYTSQWGYLNRACKAMEHYSEQDRGIQVKMKLKAMEYIRDAYRDTWSFPAIQEILAKTQHIMIWSDNDVANDFTILRDEKGNQAYTDEFLMCGMKVYREYQRQLWDLKCEGKLPPKTGRVEEWQFRVFGPCGVFLIDMKGNRITPTGIQVPDNPLMSERQRAAILSAFNTPGITCMIVCAEIPFVGDEPEVIKEKAKTLTFLRDHWTYNIDELLFLLDLCFEWKAADFGREVYMLGGDIHVGVESMIYDEMTKSNILHMTTSPITNHVCDFFPKLSGRISQRYSFVHKPLDHERNFCTLDLQFDPASRRLISSSVKLHGIPTVEYLKKQKEKDEQLRLNSLQQQQLQHNLGGFFSHGQDSGRFVGLEKMTTVRTTTAGPLEINDRNNFTFNIMDNNKKDLGLKVTDRLVGFDDNESDYRITPDPSHKLIVEISGIKGFNNHKKPLRCEVSLGASLLSTAPSTLSSSLRPKWSDVLTFEYMLEDIIILRMIDLVSGAVVGNSCFSLTPLIGGWQSFKGNIRLRDARGTAIGNVVCSIELKKSTK